MKKHITLQAGVLIQRNYVQLVQSVSDDELNKVNEWSLKNIGSAD